MKKSYVLFILLAVLLVFTGCSGSSSGEAATPEMKAAASEATIVALEAMGNAMMAMGDVSQGSTSRTLYQETIPTSTVNNVTTSGTMSYDDVTEIIIMMLNMTFTNYTDGEVTLNGTLAVNLNIDFSTFDVEGSETGTITVTYNGNTFDMIFDIQIEMSGTDNTGTISGSVTVDGTKYDMSESLTNA